MLLWLCLWQLAAAAVTGFIAKECVVGTLATCFAFEAILDETTMNRLVRDWVNRHGISLSWGVRYWPDAGILCLELSY